MEDLISRQAVLDSLHNKFADGFDSDRWWNSMSVLYVINKVPPVQPIRPRGEWIPVSERLPEKTGLYLISIGDLVTTESFDGYNFRTQAMVRFIPDAWMPLPEPYKEGEEE